MPGTRVAGWQIFVMSEVRFSIRRRFDERRKDFLLFKLLELFKNFENKFLKSRNPSASSAEADHAYDFKNSFFEVLTKADHTIYDF